MANNPERARRSPGVLNPALLALSVALAALIAVVTVLVATSASRPVWVNLLFPATAAVYGAAGILAWRRRPANGFGALLVIGALIWVAASCYNVDSRLLVAVGLVTATVSVAFVVHLLLAFPSGVLGGTLPRAVAAAAYIVMTVLQAPLYLFSAPPPPWDVLTVAERPDLVELGHDVQRVGAYAVVIAADLIMVRRMSRATPEQRRVLLPLVAYGSVAVLLIPVTASWLGPIFGPNPLVVTQVALLAGVPLAFLHSLQRGAFRPASGVEQLVGWLGRDDETRPALAEALAGTLGDPSMRLHLDGTPDVATPGRGLVEVELGGRRVGAISFDATLIHDPEQVRQAGRVVALAVDRERLTASLRSSRARIVQVGDAERRRIAADLHDGLQANLVMLSLQAYELGANPAADAEVRATAVELRAGIDEAADRLRRLVHGVMPALLIERGLYAAVEDLVDRSPVPAELRVTGSDRDLPEHVQSTAYFLVAEGLANAVKHATASRVDVRIERAPATLLVDVSDDGVGSAVAKDDGMGLHSLADRVDVLGGRLVVDSPPHGGTRLTAELPCGS